MSSPEILGPIVPSDQHPPSSSLETIAIAARADAVAAAESVATSKGKVVAAAEAASKAEAEAEAASKLAEAALITSKHAKDTHDDAVKALADAESKAEDAVKAVSKAEATAKAASKDASDAVIKAMKSNAVTFFKGVGGEIGDTVSKALDGIESAAEAAKTTLAVTAAVQAAATAATARTDSKEAAAAVTTSKGKVDTAAAAAATADDAVVATSKTAAATSTKSNAAKQAHDDAVKALADAESKAKAATDTASEAETAASEAAAAAAAVASEAAAAAAAAPHNPSDEKDIRFEFQGNPFGGRSSQAWNDEPAFVRWSAQHVAIGALFKTAMTSFETAVKASQVAVPSAEAQEMVNLITNTTSALHILVECTDGWVSWMGSQYQHRDNFGIGLIRREGDEFRASNFNVFMLLLGDLVTFLHDKIGPLLVDANKTKDIHGHVALRAGMKLYADEATFTCWRFVHRTFNQYDLTKDLHSYDAKIDGVVESLAGIGAVMTEPMKQARVRESM